MVGRGNFSGPSGFPLAPGSPLLRECGNDDAGGVPLKVRQVLCERKREGPSPRWLISGVEGDSPLRREIG